MNNYINNYFSYKKITIYDFKQDAGGIGDYIKFFMFCLELCIKNDTRLYIKKNNIEIENYIRLKHDKMYIDDNTIKKISNVRIVTPKMYYSNFNSNFTVDINEVFYFTDEVINNSKILLPNNMTNYISIHLRLGDKFLETERMYIQCKNDIRSFSEEEIYKFIEDNNDKTIFFCCDNNAYKTKIKEKYNNIVTTNCDIGHTSLSNTTKKQTLDSITEFYILSNSQLIFSGSKSGFSMIASKFGKIPIIGTI